MSSSHKASTSSLELPADPRQPRERMGRKMSHRVPPPPVPLDIPEPVNYQRTTSRSPSPLSKSFTADESDENSQDASEDGDDNQWSNRSHSPTPSMAKFASNFAQRVGALVGAPSPHNLGNHLPTEAEIEADAERERERSRREAEMILRREAEAKMLRDEGVLTSMGNSPMLTPPRQRSQAMPSTSASPSSQKEKESWFSVVKSKLTSTKEPLTPAQQIIEETKAKEMERSKTLGLDSKQADSFFMNPNMAASPEPATPPRPIVQAVAMTPSPQRSVDSSRETPLLYAQFNNQGVLDVPGTLLAVARRFEKLERWTVSHVRALEERMSDVEKWLVDRETEKEKAVAQPPPDNKSEKSSISSGHVDQDSDSREHELNEIRDEIAELQGRMGELGREMAKLMANQPASNAMPTRSTQAVPAVPPTPSSIMPRSAHTLPAASVSTPRTSPPNTASMRPKETSPPSHTPATVLSPGSGRTRLPYPTGDYTIPPGVIPTKQEVISPTNSPPSSLTESTRRCSLPVASLPPPSAPSFTSSQPQLCATLSLISQEDTSPTRRVSSALVSEAPSPTSRRQSTNISPTPHKRYTVALGAPITSAGKIDPDEYNARHNGGSRFSSSAQSDDDDDDDCSDGYVEEEDDTDTHDPPGYVRGSRPREEAVSKLGTQQVANLPQMSNDTLRRANAISTSPRTGPLAPRPRARAVSTYGPLGISASASSSSLSHTSGPVHIAPLRPRVRSRSTDPPSGVGLGISVPSASAGRFIDPLVIRKQEQEALAPKIPIMSRFERGGGKVPIGELVAFFDKER